MCVRVCMCLYAGPFVCAVTGRLVCVRLCVCLCARPFMHLWGAVRVVSQGDSVELILTLHLPL